MDIHLRVISTNLEHIGLEFDNTNLKKQVQHVGVGTKVLVKCDSNDPVIWFRQRDVLEKLPLYGRVIAFTTIRLRDWGMYICYRKNDGKERNFISTVTVKIYGMTLFGMYVL